MIPPRKSIQWTSEQESIFAHFAQGPQAGHAIVKARAGTGKTTTIKEAIVSHAPWAKRIIYLVFNKRNQLEAEAKIKDSRCEVRTFHSIGFQFVKKTWPMAGPDNNVERERANQVLRQVGISNGEQCFGPLLKLVSLAKNTGMNPESLLDAYDIDYAPFGHGDSEARANICLCATEHLKLSKIKDKLGRISFDDMVWLPVVMGWTRKWFDLVVVDETQDMNEPQLTMARDMMLDGGMLVAVGDDYQCIYGFRGCCQDGLETMRSKLSAKTLTLTVTQRNPKSVVAEAVKLVPDFKYREGAPEGSVSNVSGVESAQIGDAILSRLNAPLMPTALQLLRTGKPARIEGRDLGKQLIGMARSLKANSVPNFLVKLQSWEDKQVDRLSKSKNADKKIEQAQDIAATLRCVAEVAQNVDDITARLSTLFGDSQDSTTPAIILSSVHKAKGLEWDRVFMLCDTFKDRNQEERNIRYVAITRARRELFYVGAVPGAIAPNPEKKEEVSTNKEVATLGAIAPDMGFAPGIVWESPLPGMRWLVPGTVCRDAGGKEWVSIRLGPCNAKMVCLEKGLRTIIYRDGLDEKSKTISSGNHTESWSRQIGVDSIVRKMDDTELKEFLNGKPRGRRESNQPMGDQTTNENMKTKSKKNESSRVSRLEIAVTLAKAGKSEAAIQQAVEKATGEKNSAATLYLIGREWRREHEVGRHFGDHAATPAKKKTVPVRKAAPKKSVPAKKKTVAKKSLPAPPPRQKKVAAPTSETAPTPEPTPEAAE